MSTNETQIYYGLWNNHDDSFPFSLTLTVPTRTGNYIIAALSALVAWAGISFYGIVAYFLHQHLAARKSKDVLDLQLQVLFRSESGALESAFEGIKLYWAWKNIAKRVWRRIIPFSILAAAVWSGFIIASVLVANVASDGYGDVFVVAVPEYCGDLSFGMGNMTLDEIKTADNDPILRASKSAQDTWSQNNLKWARAYSEAHYGITNLGGTASPPASRAKKLTLPYASKDVECPWTLDTRCLGAGNVDGPAVNLDTGLLDSHADLGINAPSHERIQVRKSATCAVVDTNKFDRVFVTENNETVYGIEVMAEATVQKIPELNKTVNFFGAKDSQVMISSRKSFVLGGVPRKDGVGGGVTTFSLIPTFDTDDYDTSFFSVATDVLFYEKVQDPLYFAALEYAALTSGSNGKYAYTTNRRYNTVVCWEAYEMCNPKNQACTGLSPIMTWANKVEGLGLNSHQKVTAMRLMSNFYWGGQISQNGPEGTTGLLLQGTTSIFKSPPPDDQWKREVAFWFATSLSNIQRIVVDWSSKPWLDPQANDSLSAHVNMTRLDAAYSAVNLVSEFNEACRNTVIRTSASVQNFRVTVTLVVLCITFSILATKLLLSTIVEHVRDRKRAGGLFNPSTAVKEIARDADDKYHLLRMALEGTRIGGWESGAFGVPITRQSGDILAPRRDPVRKLARYPTFPLYSVAKDGAVEIFYTKSEADSRASTFVCNSVTESPTGLRSPARANTGAFSRDKFGRAGTRGGLQAVSEVDLESGFDGGRSELSSASSQETLRGREGDGVEGGDYMFHAAMREMYVSSGGSPAPPPPLLRGEPPAARGWDSGRRGGSPEGSGTSTPNYRGPARVETWASNARTLRGSDVR